MTRAETMCSILETVSDECERTSKLAELWTLMNEVIGQARAMLPICCLSNCFCLRKTHLCVNARQYEMLI